MFFSFNKPKAIVIFMCTDRTIRCRCRLSLFSKKIEILFQDLIECSEAANPDMSRQQQEQQLFKRTAELLAGDKLTPAQACSFIETLRDAEIFPDEMDAEDKQQKGFNEIAGVFADWKVTNEEACDLFNEWIDQWKHLKK